MRAAPCQQRFTSPGRGPCVSAETGDRVDEPGDRPDRADQQLNELPDPLPAETLGLDFLRQPSFPPFETVPAKGSPGSRPVRPARNRTDRLPPVPREGSRRVPWGIRDKDYRHLPPYRFSLCRERVFLTAEEVRSWISGVFPAHGNVEPLMQERP